MLVTLSFWTKKNINFSHISFRKELWEGRARYCSAHCFMGIQDYSAWREFKIILHGGNKRAIFTLAPIYFGYFSLGFWEFWVSSSVSSRSSSDANRFSVLRDESKTLGGAAVGNFPLTTQLARRCNASRKTFVAVRVSKIVEVVKWKKIFTLWQKIWSFSHDYDEKEKKAQNSAWLHL